ncbi:hypothetical protein E1B28_001904 [Marasmius oreades]|uniref:Uncharacterized protein n=1 Tax=Marasmius oreades TaxID=181124 RepID=A0A9P8AFX9_9AGAR|nr:uncharacterized protein E1B28_001904 [Marasmius oreades]KAG7100124.1 hypothetical protein E1B28_001904 [Marasmius oreades]
MELLQKVNKTRQESDDANTKYKACQFQRDLSDVQCKKLQARQTTTFKRYERLEEELEDYEAENGIERWSIDGAKFIDGLQGLKEQAYHRALGHLQNLVVQRLLELTKMNMSGICQPYLLFTSSATLIISLKGYKQRDQIGKAL